MNQDIITIIIITFCGFIYGAIKHGFHTYISDHVKAFLNKYFHKKIDGSKVTDEYDAIYERMVEIKTILEADRVFLDNFHNGSIFLPNRPIWRFSRSYETVANGVSYTIKDTQNILALTAWDYLAPFFDNKQRKYCYKLKGDTCLDGCKNLFGIYKFIVDKMPESYLKVILRNQGVESLILLPIIDSENIVGYIGIHFMRDFNEKDINTCVVCQKVQEISYFLNKG